jgi:hypothetical protein
MPLDCTVNATTSEFFHDGLLVPLSSIADGGEGRGEAELIKKLRF